MIKKPAYKAIRFTRVTGDYAQGQPGFVGFFLCKTGICLRQIKKRHITAESGPVL